MTRKERAKLRTEMSRLIAGFMSRGERVTTGQIRDIMIGDYPDTVEEAGRQLVSTALQNMARELMKKASKREEDDIQVNLFGSSDVVPQVPKCIAVPSHSDARELTWTSIADATLAEVDAYVEYLRKGAKADFQKAKILSIFRGRVVDLAGEDDLDTPIRELLEEFRARTAKAV